jgi:hypothetical protein
MNKIYLVRSQKVMMDRDLAELYGVETRRLKEQVKRNISRFPLDFMFELTKDELEEWRSQFGSSNEDKIGLRYAPYAFTAFIRRINEPRFYTQQKFRRLCKSARFIEILNRSSSSREGKKITCKNDIFSIAN